MLINTVILFLSDALPIVILAALLLAITSKQAFHLTWFFYSIILSIFTTFALINLVDFIAQSFDSTGIELLFSSAYVAIYCLIIALLFSKLSFENSDVWQICALLTTLIVVTLNGTNFLVYITGYWSQVDALQSLLIGMVLGGGICLSIAVLLYFFVVYCDRSLFVYTSSTLLLFYGAGQLMQAINLLSQIDWLPTSHVLWDMNSVINEKSEVGHFLKALFGYDASPTFTQTFIYFAAIVIPAVFFIVTIRKNTKSPRQPISHSQEISS
jgi:high-affinity iron transporter